MAVTDVHATTFWASGDFSGSVEVTFAPTDVRALASLYLLQVYDDIAAANVGIRGYRRRPTADGAEETKSYGSNILDWKGQVKVTKCTSITFGVYAYEDTAVRGVGVVHKLS